MKKNSILILILCIVSMFSLLIISSCGKDERPKSTLIVKDNLLYKQGSNIPFTGREKAFVDNKIVEYDVLDGFKHGEFRIFTGDGILEIEGQLDSNRNVGRWRYYYVNGQIESEGSFVNDLPNGFWLWNYPDGKKREEGNYSNGLRVGVWYQYDNNGEIIYEINYDSGDTLKRIETSQGFLKN
jgi:antitoxin component YwqK of YwqJK toxin-antitoxin module